MPTYHEVLTTDLSILTTAASRWEEMATGFKTLEERYEKDVHGVSLGEAWIGLSAQAAGDRFAITLRELQGAQKEAKAVAAVLRDAHTQLTDLCNRVKAIRDEAVEAGMCVSDQGSVSLDTARLTQAERTVFAHDPDFRQTARTRVNQWAEKLVQAVRAVTDADDGIRVALDAAVLDADPMDGTFNGFNRNPQANRYPSLEEAGKAANMPKDRKDVPAWWQSLAPVTRGILLQERGDELRAAGIMDPQYQWYSVDAGSGRFDAEDPTPEDLWFHARALAIATAGDAIGQTGASRNMLHYLRGTGETLHLDVDRMLADDSDFRTEIKNEHVSTNQDAWRQRALHEFHRAGGDKAVVVPIESRTTHTNLKSDEWFHAVGANAHNVSGYVTVSPAPHGGAPDVSLDYQVNVWDRYNWDPGKSTPFAEGLIHISDDDMGRLHKVGFGQEFDMRGSSATHHHDLNSSAAPAVTPEGQGREGTRGDVSRGEEKNR
ncbi:MULTISPECIES: hypothetical protein [unclassified Streptomyces]|uniref:hypothetical protein n=1 Tax=unclassified Streptomyces TaxID=2593676 RepID=UPI00369A5839